jgi:hypothetical protein
MLRKLLILVCLTSTMTVAFAQKKKKGKGKEEQNTAAVPAINHKEVGAPMPSIRLVTKQLKVVTDKDVKHDGPMFVMLFNPTCDHCITTANIIRKHEELFKNTKMLLMATPNQITNLQYFEDLTHYPQSKLLTVGVDSAGFIDRTYTYSALPQINVYDKDRKLVRIFNGEPTIDSLKPYIE